MLVDLGLVVSASPLALRASMNLCWYLIEHKCSTRVQSRLAASQTRGFDSAVAKAARSATPPGLQLPSVGF
jgi:hypothetical protein